MRLFHLIALPFALCAPAYSQTTQTLVVSGREYTLPSDTPATVLVTDSSNRVVVFHLAY